ncbi:MAG: glycosyltransferase family 1 protein, partial [Gammaproteobacteria bacterium]
MFLFDIPAVAYADPWVMPFGQRLAALKGGTRRIVYFYGRPDNSTFRYRVYNMIQALESEAGEASAAYFCHDDLEHLELFANRLDVLVVCCTLYDNRVNALISKVKSCGKPVLFDVDDLVFDPDYTHLILRTLDQDLRHPDVWDHWFGWIARTGATLRLCDGAITPNAFLAERIREFAGIPVAVVPNFMNREQLAISERVLEQKRASGYRRNGRIHLGYFSGTPTHNKDFELVASALERLLETDPRVVVLVVGFMDLDERFTRFGGRVEVHPFQDFINLQRLMGGVEINLVPLQYNTFTHCKSELKYFEAAAVGTISVASPT